MSNLRERLDNLPVALLVVSLLIPIIGVVNLASAAQATRPNLFLVQLAWICVAFAFVAAIAAVPKRILELVAYPAYGAVNVLLILVLVAGTTVKGSQRWLNLGVFMLQPSELAKVAIILVTARYFSRFVKDEGYTLRDLLYPMNISRPLGALVGAAVMFNKMATKAAEAVAAGELPGFVPPGWLQAIVYAFLAIWLGLSVFVLVREGPHARRVVAPVDVVLVPFALVLIEPDLGTSLIVIAIAGAQILFCGIRKWSLVIATCALGFTVLFGWSFLLKPYQKKRVETFLNPENDLQGAGYHSSQSMIAIGSGQLTGKGMGNGTQTQLSFLPENHTDFVFSVLAEEWGFVGAAVLILLFLLLILFMLREARDDNDRFAVLINVGCAAMVFCHVVINIGMVTGMLPVVGVTLPFMSYGGSSMVTQMMALGLCVNTALWRRR